ncbi:MAG: hypothetical protein GY860_23430, partial [Desulfobacteraceae bacterium]|nr:hypothetical protein [Desulfobacteraceae bacterium]
SFIKRANLPLGFLTEEYLGVIGGLFLDRPMYYDNYREGELYRHFTSLTDINTTDKILNQITHLDQILSRLPLDLESFTHGVLTYKSLVLTLWARNRLGLDNGSECSLNPIDPLVFKPFFAALFSSDTPGKIDEIKAEDLALWVVEALDCPGDELPEPFMEVLSNLIGEIEGEYSTVSSDNMDPRFIPHFLLTPDPGDMEKD